MASGGVTSDVEKGSEDIPLSETNVTRLPDIKLETYVHDIVMTSDGNLIVLHANNIRYKTPACYFSRVNIYTSVITQITGYINEGCQRISRENDTRFIVLNGNGFYNVCLNGNTLDSSPTPGPANLKCFDVDMIESFMVMSFDDGTIRIKPLKGRTNAPSTQGFLISRVASLYENVFRRYVCLVREQNVPVAYLSDTRSLESNHVTKLSMDGMILMVYNDWRYWQAGPIAATGDGHVFVAFNHFDRPNESCIQLITPSMENAVTVLTSADAITNPTSMRYDQNKKRLYVVNEKAVKIMVFEFN